MDKQVNIHVIRDNGGTADIGTAEDGAIEQMFDVGNRHLILKERSIYEFILADQVDPERTNAKLPTQIQRLVLDRGAHSDIVCRSFLTAKRLIDTQFLGSEFDVQKALTISLDVLIELCVLGNEINAYLAQEQKLITWYEERRNSKNYAIPSLIDVKTRCKTIFQKADHISQGIMEIIRLFFPEFLIQHYYSQFLTFIEDKYNKTDPFSVFLSESVPFLEIVRNARNCLDHRRTETIIKDFELQKEGNILSPTIEMNYRSSQLERMSLEQFLTICNSNMLTIFELMIGHLCSKNVQPMGMIRYELREVPENQRRNPLIRYAFWSNLPGGYYHQ